MKKILKSGKSKGFALITTLLGLVLMSILGLAIIGVTTSNYKTAIIDSRNQSAYYIAESGINYMLDRIYEEVHKNKDKYTTSSDFFQHIENQFTNSTLTLDNFDENNGVVPKAYITVNKIATHEGKRDYKIMSVGEIGDSKRSVSSIISISWKSNKNLEIFEDTFIYCPKFTFSGSAIEGEGGTVIAGALTTHDLNGGAKLSVSNMYFGGPVTMNGGSASFGSKDNPGMIYIDGDLRFESGTRNVYGDVYVNGNAVLKDAILHGDIYVNGNVKFIENGPTPNGKIYYTGEIEAPSYYKSNSYYQNKILSKCIKVDSVPTFNIPKFDVKMKNLSWYSQNGYTIAGNVTQDVIPDNAKLVVDNYYSEHYTSPKGNIIIISKNDIEIKGWRDIKGVLIAIDGKVKLQVASFTGVIISKEDFKASGGGWSIYMRNLSDYFNESTLPIDVSEVGGSGTGSGTSGDVGSGIGGTGSGGSVTESNIETKIQILSPIRED